MLELTAREERMLEVIESRIEEIVLRIARNSAGVGLPASTPAPGAINLSKRYAKPKLRATRAECLNILENTLGKGIRQFVKS